MTSYWKPDNAGPFPVIPRANDSHLFWRDSRHPHAGPYDTAGRQTLSRQKADPGGADGITDYVVRSLYNSGGQLTGRVSAGGNTTAYAYDQYGRQTKTTLPENSYTASDYNASGRLTKQVQYEIVSGNTRSFRHDYLLDALGRAVTTINQGPDGTFGNGDDLSTRCVYDGAGRQVTATDEAGKVDVYAYDALGRKTGVTEDSAGIARLTEFTFDHAGRMVTLTAFKDSPSTGQENTLYQYNGRGLQTIVTYEHRARDLLEEVSRIYWDKVRERQD